MNKSYLYTIILSTALSVLFVSSTRAAVVVYTDPVAWESALENPQNLMQDDFESYSTGGLSNSNFFTDFTGGGPYGVFMGIYFDGDPGSNAIDAGATALSPNGSTYYLGEVSEPATIPRLEFQSCIECVIDNFGADWVVQGNLFLEVDGMVISFSDYLPTGSGFLGVISDVRAGMFGATLSGSAAFGMDNVRVAPVPVPSAVWLFGSGLLGLVGIARRKKA